MLLRIVVVALCVTCVVGELQCAGPGRFSTTPGTCTSEYYTCNRDVNKDYVAYVLSCPGNTLFNERTRKCSSARTVFCTPPTSAAPSGQIRVTTLRRQKLTTRETVSRISRPVHTNKRTTKRGLIEYRRPDGRPTTTTRPYLKGTSSMTPKPKLPASQWRIRPSNNKKTTTLEFSDRTDLRRRTNSANKQKEKAKLHNKTGMVDKQSIAEGINSSTTTYKSVANTPQPFATIYETNPNITTPTPLYTTESPLQPVTLKNFYIKLMQTDGTLQQPSSTTVKMDFISHVSLVSKCEQQITPGLFTTPVVVTPQTSTVENVFETTPEVILKNNSPIPFMDSLEASEEKDTMEIIYVDGNSDLKHKIKKTEDEEQNHSQIKQIRYFYDPDINSFSQKAMDGNSKMSSKRKKLHKKHRQPKIPGMQTDT